MEFLIIPDDNRAHAYTAWYTDAISAVIGAQQRCPLATRIETIPTPQENPDHGRS